MSRISNVSRKTSETDITIKMNLDGEGKYNISTGVNFFNHMLESFSKHSMIDLEVDASGDIEIDDHHTIEDVGILLGEAFLQAIGDKKGIKRMAHAIVPMDAPISLRTARCRARTTHSTMRCAPSSGCRSLHRAVFRISRTSSGLPPQICTARSSVRPITRRRSL